MNAVEAKKNMLDWAEGRRDWCNLGPHPPHTPDVIAIMNTQEVVKWAAVYQALKEIRDE